MIVCRRNGGRGLLLLVLVLCAKMQRGPHRSRESLRLRGRGRGTARGERRDEGAVAVDHEAVVALQFVRDVRLVELVGRITDNLKDTSLTQFGTQRHSEK